MLKFLHTADIHLDSPMLGLERYDVAPIEAMRSATRRAFENLVELAIEERVDFVLIAGDLFDGDWRDFNTGLFLNAKLEKLGRAEIPVYVVSGNHDAASQITRSLRWPENVFVFPTKNADTVTLEDKGASIHGQGYAKRAVSKNLATGYPAPVEGNFNIGLLHTSLGGYQGHEPYAPCSEEDLTDRGYDYWALGHVHKRQVVRAQDPAIVFPGNIQGRNIRETGAKGATLVRVDEDRRVELHHIPVDVARWRNISIDLSGAQTGPDARQRIDDRLTGLSESADGRLSAVRLALCGSCEAHWELIEGWEELVSQIRNTASSVSGSTTWVEKVRLETRAPIDEEKLKRDTGPVGDLLRYLDSVAADSEQLDELASKLKPVRNKIPARLRREGLDLSSEQAIRSFLDQARELLLVRLHSLGEGEP
jgi:DNA repair exonuclease SbcCD nuclease subunit